ncbi:hypothetical protein [Neptunitalea lumnitzerae]|uniref:TonB-dependent receptor plug domain-containing protein n=1 Tax=Neptunitalea lumnitzerae TaxID=2965509 RepID=A0ABQ5MGP1_9FLAO|nr:hypothetical protein [Neptunitalea sp. Y10]GLB48558.1 hypothetical protein Y10_09260 [Neptunitalea sp. Y10]
MKFQHHLVILLFIIPILCFSQSDNPNSKTIEHYENYFNLEQETIYAQLNKSTYLPGEELWFKTYIYNTKTEKPYLATSNLQVTLFNNEGTPITTKTFYTENGSSYGNFKIDSTLTPGTYYFKASTEYMKNFKQDRSYITSFNIISSSVKYKQKEVIAYDLQLLPESGHFLEGVKNTIGVKIIDDNGKPAVIKNAEVTNKKNEVITTFKTNQFGLGKFSLELKTNNSYIVKATLSNDSVITKSINHIEKEGFLIQTEAVIHDLVNINVQTNTATSKKLNKQHYTLFIHKEGTGTSIDIPIEKNKSSYDFAISKDELFAGINIVTLLDASGNPIAERLIYNPIGTKIEPLTINNIVTEADSILVTLKTKNPTDSLNLSVSALPENTESYSFKNNIHSTFILAPFIKGAIENPSYYFKNTDRKTLYNLDLLLLTQGWSSYDWKDIFYTNKAIYPFENGFSIKGGINNFSYDPENKLVLFSPENGFFIEAPLDENNKFEVHNIAVIDSSEINFSLINKREKNKKPKVYFTVLPQPHTTNKLPLSFLENDIYVTAPSNHIIDTVANNYSFIQSDVILSDVVVTENKINGEPDHFPLGYSRVTGTYLDFDHPRYKNSPESLENLIRRNGFEVSSDGISTFNVFDRRGLRRARTVLFLDNVPVDDFNQYSLTNLQVRDLEEIFFNKNAAIFGMGGRGGVIHIFTKRGTDSQKNGQKVFKNYATNYGYTPSKKYYSPLYNKSDIDTFESYGVLNWIPNVQQNEAGEYYVIIPKHYSNINLYIEGMDENGKLFSEVLTVNTKVSKL